MSRKSESETKTVRVKKKKKIQIKKIKRKSEGASTLLCGTLYNYYTSLDIWFDLVHHRAINSMLEFVQNKVFAKFSQIYGTKLKNLPLLILN